MDAPLHVIVVTFNSREVIAGCLTRFRDADDIKVTVIDNASRDGTPDWVRQCLPSAEVIELPGNIGYGRAANVGLRLAACRFALLINPDLIAEPAEVRKLVAHAVGDHPAAAVWAPATKEKDRRACAPEDVHWVSGCAMLFDVPKVAPLGFFDENIFLFSEETDLCERVIRAGLSIRLCRDVFFDHFCGMSSPPDARIQYMKWWHFGWSQCYRMTKNGHRTWFRNPLRKHLNYRLHSLISTSAAKRRKWKAKADGARAFLRGEKAFREDGTPQMS